MSNGLFLLLFLTAFILFFWGTYKAMKTQQKVYLAAMIPVGILIVWMFVI